ncbi:MAG: hydrogenase expression/formation protein HypE, partial [Candidatus Desulfatibia sp.]|uniref:hydrogenase expression/formation protein HypE n=1 Tax=Candidatus Desulfatibia sp. TaxID=3101189 RepID=UPI002F2E5770
YISAGFIIEEGFLIDDLKRIADSMGEAARACGVKIVTGDTKVVARGGADKLFINTTGIGFVPEGVEIGAQRVTEGDAIILSGTIGDHGAAVLTKRKGLDFKTTVESDSQPLNGLVKDMLAVCPDIHMLRDPTRGGLAATLTEIAASSKKGILIDEKAIPVNESVRSICEILGLDVLQIANEGKLVAFVPEESAEKVLDAMRNHKAGKDAAIIGRVSGKTGGVEPGVVEMKTAFIGNRLIEPPTGDMLPRIC